MVEDDENDVFFLKVALNRLQSSLALQTVRNGREAINYLLGKGEYQDRSTFPLPELILLDLRMPLMNGFDFLNWRNTTPFTAIPVVVFEGSGNEADHQRANELGAQCICVKPNGLYGFDRVVQQMTELLQGMDANKSQPLEIKPSRSDCSAFQVVHGARPNTENDEQEQIIPLTAAA